LKVQGLNNDVELMTRRQRCSRNVSLRRRNPAAISRSRPKKIERIKTHRAFNSKENQKSRTPEAGANFHGVPARPSEAVHKESNCSQGDTAQAELQKLPENGIYCDALLC
jgi:hypothetical protein